MEIDRDKAIKLVIIVIATIAALAVMNVAVQLIQTILPFLIVAGGVYAGYRWVLSDSAAPTADEVEQQARGLFSRFRRTKEAAETVVKVGTMMNDLQGKSAKPAAKAQTPMVVQAEVVKKEMQKAPVSTETEEVKNTVKLAAEEETENTETVVDPKASYKNELEVSEGDIEFKDKDVIISSKDLVQPDISRLEDKEKEVPKVTDDVLSQIEARRKRLQEGKQ